MRNIAEIIKDDRSGIQLSQTERQIAVAYFQGKYDAVSELNSIDNNSNTNEVLNKIRSEIDRQQKWLLQAGYTAYNVDIALDAIKAVVAERSDKG